MIKRQVLVFAETERQAFFGYVVTCGEVQTVFSRLPGHTKLPGHGLFRHRAPFHGAVYEVFVLGEHRQKVVQKQDSGAMWGQGVAERWPLNLQKMQNQCNDI